MMDIRTFGDALIETGDLDPVYYVRQAQLPEPQLARLLLAYWCFYHLGVAAWLSEQESTHYWNWMREAAANDVQPPPFYDMPITRWPRASERRHFRGAKCVAAVEWLREHSNGSPESWVRILSLDHTEKQIMAHVMEWPMFGPWIAFKAADMMERVYGAPITFDRNIGLLYESPRHGLERLVATPEFITTDRSPEFLYSGLLAYFSPRRAPPARDRGCGPAEAETILCKWDSHAQGHYWVGRDIKEVRHALAGWGTTADCITRVMPSEVTAQEHAA